MAETKTSIYQHLKEAEERLKEFSNLISSVTDQSCQDGVIDKMNHIEVEIERKMKMQENVTSSNQKTVQELEAEAEALSFKINSHKKSINLLQDEMNHLSKEKTLLNNVPDGDIIMATKVKQLEDEDLVFRKHLGMEVRKVKGGCLQVALSQIDHKQPNSLFIFSLRLDENRRYNISDCKPYIADLDAIVEKLNSDNDFHKFVHTMRRRFKELVA